jgi:acyl-coenzyme A synthetase/AMP-(fatty) acid ligase
MSAIDPVEGRARSSRLYEAVRAIADERPEACVIRTTDGASLSYVELIELTDRLAAGLLDNGVDTGDTVACSLRNSAGYVALIMAAASIGACYVPLMANFDPAETAIALELTRPKLIVADGHREVSGGDVPVVALDVLTGYPALTGRDAGESYPGVFRKLWTSGSTGFPKLLAWRQDKFVTERHRWLADTGIVDTDVFFCRHTLDVAHATDLHVFAALLSGAQLVLADPEAAPAELLRQLQEYRVTVMSALPRHYEQLVLAAGGPGRVDLSRLRRPLCGGAYVSPAVVRDSAEVLGIHIRQIYGSTEFGLALGNMADVVQADGSMVPVAGVGTRLASLTADTPDIGELVLCSPCTSEGYLNNPAAHARTFRDGEFWTGDVARRASDGSYRILGRVSEALATPNGPVLAPMLDEEIVGSCPVAESVTLPVDPGSEEEITKSVGGILAHHGLTGPVHVVPAVPHTPVGKADKPRLRREWVEGREWDERSLP